MQPETLTVFWGEQGEPLCVCNRGRKLCVFLSLEASLSFIRLVSDPEPQIEVFDLLHRASATPLTERL